MNADEVVIEWIKWLKEPRPELGGHRVCPFANKIRNIVIVDKLDNTLVTREELTIYVEKTKKSSAEEITTLCHTLNEQYSNLVFLPDHPDKKTFIGGIETGNGHLPLIISQSKQELKEAREKLRKTDYYSYWDEDYLIEINSYGSMD